MSRVLNGDLEGKKPGCKFGYITEAGLFNGNGLNFVGIPLRKGYILQVAHGTTL